MRAADIMTRDVATVHSSTTIADAATKMAQARISGLPVLDDKGALAGIVTEGDLLHRVELGTAPHHPSWLNFLRGPALAASDYVRSHTRIVEDIMTPDPSVVAPDATLDEVVQVMERDRIRRVPVVQDGKLVGIVSRSDLVRALANLLRPTSAENRPDETIRADMLAELQRQGWFGMCNVRVAVHEGRVTLEGIAQSEAVHRALRVAAEGVAGVVGVDHQVTVLDPVVTAIGA